MRIESLFIVLSLTVDLDILAVTVRMIFRTLRLTYKSNKGNKKIEWPEMKNRSEWWYGSATLVLLCGRFSGGRHKTHNRRTVICPRPSRIDVGPLFPSPRLLLAVYFLFSSPLKRDRFVPFCSLSSLWC